MRVLHAPVNVGNQAWVLSRHERMLGIESDLIVNYVTSGYSADRVIGRVGGKSNEEITERLITGLRVPLEYDVFHYYFGRTLLHWDDYDKRSNYYPYLDLEIAKRLGRPIFFTLQGCDVRIAAESTARYEFTPCKQGACTLFDDCIRHRDSDRRQFIADVLPRADRFFYLNPELGHYTGGGDFLPYSSVEIDSCIISPPALNRPPRILHAPTDGAIKGTALILQALESLKSEYEFELLLVQGRSHPEAMAIYQSADIVIDQVLAGWYGGFAVEAMAMGKPVMCYLREQDFKFVPEAMIADCPIRNIRPDQVAADIAATLDRRSEWPDWSMRSRKYVETWHNPSVIAAAMIDMYKNPQAPFGFEDRVQRTKVV